MDTRTGNPFFPAFVRVLALLARAGSLEARGCHALSSMAREVALRLLHEAVAKRHERRAA